MLRVLLVFSFIWVMMVACSRDNKVTGVATETTNGISGIVRDDDGGIVEGATVYLINDSGVVVDTVTTNENGIYFFEVQPGAGAVYSIYGVSADSSKVFEHDSVSVPDEGRVELETGTTKAGEISGTISLPKHSASRFVVDLEGTIYQQELDEDYFSFKSIPAGDYTIKVWLLNNNEHPTTLYAEQDVSLLEGEVLQVTLDEYPEIFADSVYLIDDFELWEDPPANINGMYWWEYTDEREGSTTSIEFLSNLREVGQTGGYEGDRSGEVVFNFDNLNSSFVGIGFHLGEGNVRATYDYSKLTRLSMWARGKGSYEIKFCIVSNAIAGANVCHTKSTPGEDWEELVLADPLEWSEFNQSTDANFSSIREEVLLYSGHFMIQFVSTSDGTLEGEFQFDNLSFHFFRP